MATGQDGAGHYTIASPPGDVPCPAEMQLLFVARDTRGQVRPTVAASRMGDVLCWLLHTNYLQGVG